MFILIDQKQDLDEALKLASIYSTEIIIEQFIGGREFTVGILGNKTLDVVEIIPESGIYDYQSKYTKGATTYFSPAELDTKITNLIKNEAVKIYKSLGCRHYARVDFLLDKEFKPYLLEVNTLPGLCATSLLPISAKSIGIDFSNLLDLIINISIIDNDIVL